MTKNERIAALEAKVAELEMEVARLKASNVPMVYAPYQSVVEPWSAVCVNCGMRGSHACLGRLNIATGGSTWAENPTANITAIYHEGVPA